eukprot:366229-Chlamydomonas_euryale.AAC.26
MERARRWAPRKNRVRADSAEVSLSGTCTILTIIASMCFACSNVALETHERAVLVQFGAQLGPIGRRSTALSRSLLAAVPQEKGTVPLLRQRRRTSRERCIRSPSAIASRCPWRPWP